METIAIGVGTGAVLGASTLPFYPMPGKNLMNIVYGASFGAALGVGAAVYGLYQTGVSPEREDEELEEMSAEGQQSGHAPAPDPTLKLTSIGVLDGAGDAYRVWLPIVSIRY